MAAMARELKLWVVAGTQPIAVEGDARPANACVVYDPAGKRAARYDKIHLFDVDLPGGREGYRESANARPGAKPFSSIRPRAARAHRVLRFALSLSCSANSFRRVPKFSACRPRSQARPGARIGRRCFGPAPSKTSAS
jgi:hypothetical protein